MSEDRARDGEVDPRLLDSAGLKRRVLLTGALTVSLYFVSSYLLFAAGLPGWMMIGVVLLLWVGVVRPLMAPVRASVTMQRALAYEAFLRHREQERG